MVTGNGMIARRFATYAANDNHVIFASGVSDSGTTAPQVFGTEEALLRKTIAENGEKRLVYFSTCGIYDTAMQSSVYIKHKLAMEELIQEHCSQYCIFRVSNPVGVTNNPHTVLNYFVQHIKAQLPFDVWNNASRNLIDLDDMFTLCDYLLANPVSRTAVINIANPGNYAVHDIVQAIEKQVRIKARYRIVDKQSHPLVDVEHLLLIYKLLGIQFEENYLEKILEKYFR